MSTRTIVEKNLIERIDFIQVSVKDLNLSKEWYARHFGFKEDFNNEKLCVMMPPQPIPTGLPTLLLSAAGQQKNWFFNGEQKAGIIGFHCKNMHELQAYFAEQSIEASEIEDDGFAYFMHFFDPDGNMFELIELKNSQ